MVDLTGWCLVLVGREEDRDGFRYRQARDDTNCRHRPALSPLHYISELQVFDNEKTLSARIALAVRKTDVHY